MAVVTSGTYENFCEINGKKYSDIIDPRTGYPATGTKNVTIVCPDAELADALAGAVFILGEKEGIAMIDQLNGIECLLVNEKDELRTSKKLKLSYSKNEDSERQQTIKIVGQTEVTKI